MEIHLVTMEIHFVSMEINLVSMDPTCFMEILTNIHGNPPCFHGNSSSFMEIHLVSMDLTCFHGNPN